MNINYFKGVNTIDELKKMYKKLAKQYHPDLNLDKDTTKNMVDINNEYEFLFGRLANEKDTKAGHKVNDNFRSIIDELLKEKFAGIMVEIVGSWIWVSGNTYAVKEDIKALGFKWSKGNKKWYLGECTGKKKGAMSWKKKVDMFGVEVVKQASKVALIG
jgi:hypothetical protein